MAAAVLTFGAGPRAQAATANPAISGANKITINEDTTTNVVYTISDPVTPSFGIQTWATSSSQSLVSSNNLSVLGIGKNRTLSVTPSTNANGTATITLYASNGTTTNSLAISLTVQAVNDPPSFALASSTINLLEDFGSYTNLTFATSISKGPTNEASQTLTFHLAPQTPSDTNKFSTQPAISATGVLTFKSATNQNGSNIVFNVWLQDNGGTANGGKDTSSTNTFTINITPVNDPPVILSTTSFTLNENSTTNITLNVSDVDSTFSTNTCTNAWFVSSNPGLLDPTTVTVTRNATNYTLTITPTTNTVGTNILSVVVDDGAGANSRGTNNIQIVVRQVNQKPSFTISTNVLNVAEDAGITTVTGFVASTSTGPANESSQSITNYVMTFAPTNALKSISISASNGNLTYQTATNFNGAITVNARAQDNGGTNFGGVNLSDTNVFTINVAAVNDPPWISGLTNITMLEDKPWTNTFHVSDVDTAMSSVSITATNYDTNLFQSIVITGSNTNYTFVITPVTNANSVVASPITILADDGSATNNTNFVTFNVIVTPVNDPPVITLASATVTVAEDAGAQTVTNFIASASTGPSNESSQSITNYLVTTSSNAFFKTLPAISVSGDLTFTTATNAFGSVTVKVQAQDNGGTNNGGVNVSATNTFTLTVTGVNDAPVISGLPSTNVVMYEDRKSTNTFLLSDVDTPLTNITVTATSSDTTTIPNANITLSGTTSNRTVVILPATNLNTTSPITITLIADDHGSTNNTTTNSFTVTVTAVNDPPSFSLASTNVTAQKFNVTQTIASFATSISTGPADESSDVITFHLTAAAPSLFSQLPAISTNGTLTFKIANGASGKSQVMVWATDNGGTANGGKDTSTTNTFTVTIPSNPFQYLSGEFDGLFYTTNGISFQDSGFLQFTINTNGVITTGTVALAGKQYALTNGAAQFNIDTNMPTAQFTVDRSADGLTNLTVTAILDASDNWTESFSGTVACTAWTDTADLLGDHAYKDTYAFKTDDQDSIQTGTYTLFIPGNGSGNPNGYGYGTVTVNTNGVVSLAGKLGDGEVISQTNTVSAAGAWPLFVNIYTSGSNGVFMGWVNFTATSTNDLSGLVSWIKNVDTSATDYTNGFANDSVLEGSVFTAPSATEQALALAQAKATFNHGGLGSPTSFTCIFPLSPATAATSVTPATNNALSVNNTTGVVTGTFDNSGSAVNFEGVVFQKTLTGKGFFMNSAAAPDSSGSVTIATGP
jgi:hypothetical protein